MKKTIFIITIVAFSIVINVNVDKGTNVTFKHHNDNHSLPIHPPVG